MLQKITRLLHPKISQVLLGGLSEDSLKRAEQMASADADVACNILHRDRVGIIRRYKLDALLHIIFGRVLHIFTLGTVHEHCEHRVEPPGHLDGVLKLVAPGIVDVQDLPTDIISAGGVVDHRFFRGKIGGGENHGGVAPCKTHPRVFPGGGLVCEVEHLGVWVHQKGVSRAECVRAFSAFVKAPSGDDVMDQIVVTDAWSPLIERITFLETDVVDGEGDEFLLDDLVRIFIIFIHHKLHSSASIIEEKEERMQHIYI